MTIYFCAETQGIFIRLSARLRIFFSILRYINVHITLHYMVVKGLICRSKERVTPRKGEAKGLRGRKGPQGP